MKYSKLMSNDPSSEEVEKFKNKFNELSKEAYFSTDDAMEFDANRRKPQAIRAYRRAIYKMNKVVSIARSTPRALVKTVKRMVRAIMKTRDLAELRMKVLKRKSTNESTSSSTDISDLSS